MRIINRILSTALVVVLLAVPEFASAINYGGIGGRPANPVPGNPRTESIFIYTLKPGQQATDGVRIQNNTTKEQTVTLDAVDSEIASGGNFTCKQAVEQKHDVGSWIQLESSSVTVPANSSQVVPFTVTVPNNANISVGEHDGCVTLQAASQTATPSDKSGIVLSFRSAIRVVVTIPGKIVKKLSIHSVTVTSGRGSTYQINSKIANDGNVSLDTTVSVGLQSVLGSSAPLTKKGTSPILPRNTTALNYAVKRPFWGGLYRAHVVATYNSNPTTGLGQDQTKDSRSIVKDSAIFFAVPEPLALVIELLVLAVVVGGVYLLIAKRRQSRHIKRHWTSYTVKKGETLQSVAERHNVSWRKIAQVNKLKPPYQLRKGDTLKLPASKE